MLKSFLLAVQFLTRIPVPLTLEVNKRQAGQSVLFYPLAGLLIGLVLTGLGLSLHNTPASLASAIILTTWIFLSGGLHLDGLADCADAWVGGTGNREKTLAIMKDPAAGAVAVIVLIVVLLLKWTAMAVLLSQQQLLALLLIPVLGRCTILVLMLTTPYVRKNGLGEQLIQYLPRNAAWLILAVITITSSLLLGLAPLFFALLTLILIRHTAISRLGGMTGDVYGASVELVEMMLLISLALYV